MKKITFLTALITLLLTGCSTYQYQARQIDINRRNIDTEQQLVGITVNYFRQITATSSYQTSLKDAIAEAEFLCIQNSKVDVVVDPIWKVERNPWRIKDRYKATIIGFAGMYENKPTCIENAKGYTIEEIEKFKLLYDDSFPQYYYRNTNSGDTYYFNTKKAEDEKTDKKGGLFGWFSKMHQKKSK